MRVMRAHCCSHVLGPRHGHAVTVLVAAMAALAVTSVCARALNKGGDASLRSNRNSQQLMTGVCHHERSAWEGRAHMFAA